MAGGKKILVADDSLTIQKVIRLALSNENYEIQAVSEGNDAVQQISLFRPDIVLVDVSLPGKNAFEVKEEINAQGDFEETRFILMSSAFEKVDEAQATSVVFHGRLTKPFDPAHLRSVLTEVLSQVTAKRKERTQFIEQPPQELLDSVPSAPPAPPTFPSNEISEDATNEELSIAPPPSILSSYAESFAITPAPESFEPIQSLAPTIDEQNFTPPVVQNLWEESHSESSMIAPPSSFPSFETKSSDSDIRQLTESTLRMSGLEQPFENTLGESSEDSSDLGGWSIPPHPAMADLGATTFKIDKPQMPIARPSMQTLQQTASPSIAQASKAAAAHPGMAGIGRPAPKTDSVATVAVQAQAISTEEIEKMIQEQVAAHLTRITQQIIPDIAERLIKQEINKMLLEK